MVVSEEERRQLGTLWPRYFEAEGEPQKDDGRVVIIDVLAAFLLTPSGHMLLARQRLEGAESVFAFDFQVFCDAIPLSDFDRVLHHQPLKAIACVSLACVLAMLRLRVTPPAERVRAQFFNVKPSLPIASVKSDVSGKFVELTGSIVRASSIRPLVVQCDFECLKCGEILCEPFVDGHFHYPKRCVASRCRSLKFELKRRTAVTVDHQRVKLQALDCASTEPGRMPATIEVELRGPLVDAAVPGDVVRVAGVVSSQNAEHLAGRGGRRANECGLFVLYLLANSVHNSREGSGELQGGLRFSRAELRMVRRVASEPFPLALLVASLAPSIFGQPLVKLGLLLGIAGGSARRTEVPVRADPHVLVVGDPGLGKSQMLSAAARAAPRGVYVCGNAATASGLTVTAYKEGREVGLEAGALVLSDRGVCCLDEFDKMASQHSALLEAMEQQRVSIAKSGVVASLSTRCAVLAAANPTGGTYNRRLSVTENLRMSAALLSRFDLIFILVDDPDGTRDRALSRHLINMYTSADPAEPTGAIVLHDCARPRPAEDAAEDETLQQRLRRTCKAYGAGTPLLPEEMLRRYLSYARTFCQPRLTPAAAAVLQDEYLRLRREARGGRSTPVTTRQLESLVRLAEARAKVELRSAVTAEDARDVVMLMQEGMLDAFLEASHDAGLGLGGRRGGGGLGRRLKAFVAKLHAAAKRRSSNLFSVSELREHAAAIGVKAFDFDNFLEVLRHECYLLRKGAGLFAVQGSGVA